MPAQPRRGAARPTPARPRRVRARRMRARRESLRARRRARRSRSRRTPPERRPAREGRRGEARRCEARRGEAAGTKAAGRSLPGRRQARRGPPGRRRRRRARRRRARRSPARRVGRPAIPPPPGPGLVVGPVPVLARAAGAAALGAAVLLLVAPAFPLARSGGQDLGGAGNLFGFVPVLPLAAVAAAAGVLAVRGRLPRLGLAVLLSRRHAGRRPAAAHARAASDTGSRTHLDLPLGIGTSARYEVAAGCWCCSPGYGLLVVAAVLAAAAWPRTRDGGRRRASTRSGRGWPPGVWPSGCSPRWSSAWRRTRRASRRAPRPLPERAGLDLLAAPRARTRRDVWAVLAATLRPRLAVVGAYAGLAAVLLSEGLGRLAAGGRSPAIGPSAGGVGTLLAGLAMAVLAWTALGGGWRRPAASAARYAARQGRGLPWWRARATEERERTDPGGRRQAGARRPRPGRQGRRARAARRRHGGHLHRAAPDARAGRRDRRSRRTPTRSACPCCPART